MMRIIDLAKQPITYRQLLPLLLQSVRRQRHFQLPQEFREMPTGMGWWIMPITLFGLPITIKGLSMAAETEILIQTVLSTAWTIQYGEITTEGEKQAPLSPQ